MANNTLKYRRVDARSRERLRDQWNRPVLWPLWLVGGLLVAGALPAVRIFRLRERASGLSK